MPLVDVAWVQAHLDELTVVDVRWYIDGRSGRDAFAGGHIPGAVWADLDIDLSAPASTPGGRHPLPTPDDFAAAMVRLGVADDSRVVCYDDVSGGIAARLWWMLDALGHEVSVLDGGLSAWTEAGGPLETGAATLKSGSMSAHFTARPWPKARLVDANGVAEAVESGESVILDGRSAERFRGDENPIDPRFGHIPTATSAPWNDNIDPATGRFRSPDELGRRFAALSVAVGDEQGANDVIAYCGSGVTACNNLLALRLLDQPATLYVGSWSEWGADLDRPIATT